MGVDSFGAWGESMSKYFEQSKKSLKERLTRDKMDLEQDHSLGASPKSVSRWEFAGRMHGLYMSSTIRDGYVPKKKSDRTASPSNSSGNVGNATPPSTTATSITETLPLRLLWLLQLLQILHPAKGLLPSIGGVEAHDQRQRL